MDIITNNGLTKILKQNPPVETSPYNIRGRFPHIQMVHEQIMSNRFLVTFPPSFDIPLQVVDSITIPTFRFDQGWDNMTIVCNDYITPLISQELGNEKTIFSYIEVMYENDEFLMSMISRYKEINAKIVPLLEIANRAKEIMNIVDNTNVSKLTKTFCQRTNVGLSTPKSPKSILEGLMKSKDMINRVKKNEEVKSSTQDEEFELFKKNNKFIKNFLAGFEQDKQSEETIEFFKNNPPKSCDEIPKEVQEALDKDLAKKNQ